MKTQLKEHIFLIGFMGVGKTATSHVLSKLSGTKEFDTDQMIVKQEHKSIPDIFAEEGEEYFRQREGIISCGGGMVMREVNVDKMKEQGKIVLLTATPETIYEHVKDSTNRPLLNGNMNIPYITKMMEARESKYRAAADIVIETDGCTPKQVAQKLLEKYAQIG